MEIGTAGIPFDLAENPDWNQVFAQLAASGIDVFYPNSIYEEYPVVRGLGYESDFVPHPFGSATSDIYDIARAHGIKISFSADLLFPLDRGGVDPNNSPLQAIIDAGGADIIHSIANYDEPAWNGLDPALSQAVFDHVKSIDPTIQVIQVHAAVASDDPSDYLDAVLDHAQWADAVGFSVYPIGAISGARTPLQPDILVPPAQALQDYMTWLQSELGDHDHIMVLQGFERSDLFSTSALASASSAGENGSRPPTALEMREMLIAVEDADTVFWWGPGLQPSANGDVWQSILGVSSLAANDALGTPMAALQDVDATANAIDEDATGGTQVGITLFAEDLDAIDVVRYSLNDNRFQVGANGVVTTAPGAVFDYETETQLTIEGTATSTDGSVSTVSFDIEIRNVTDQINGTGGDDQLLGAEGVDVIAAGAGNDLISALG
ncbi:MAG: hypothetical protein WBC93_13790, partial [Sulfitobacter sp.]